MQISTACEIPAHVPPDLVRTIGLTDGDAFLADPFPSMAGLHDTQPPIFFNPSHINAGAWNVIRHEDCFYVPA